VRAGVQEWIFPLRVQLVERAPLGLSLRRRSRRLPRPQRRIYLPKFLRHYRELGAKHIVLVDNTPPTERRDRRRAAVRRRPGSTSATSVRRRALGGPCTLPPCPGGCGPKQGRAGEMWSLRLTPCLPASLLILGRWRQAAVEVTLDRPIVVAPNRRRAEQIGHRSAVDPTIAVPDCVQLNQHVGVIGRRSRPDRRSCSARFPCK
jgi:hypothetical protein